MALQAELPIRADDSQREADVVFVVKSARTGRVAASGTDVMPLPRQPAPGRSTAMGQFQVQFDAPPGEYVMRVVVREPGGATGSVDRRFEVRQFDGVDVTASDLVIGRQAGGLPVRPKAYSTDVLSGGLEIYARRAADLERVEVMATLVPAGGEALFRVAATLLDVTQDGPVASRGARIEGRISGAGDPSFARRFVQPARSSPSSSAGRDPRRVACQRSDLRSPRPRSRERC
jgi:hypothetical protein